MVHTSPDIEPLAPAHVACNCLSIFLRNVFRIVQLTRTWANSIFRLKPTIPSGNLEPCILSCIVCFAAHPKIRTIEVNRALCVIGCSRTLLAGSWVVCILEPAPSITSFENVGFSNSSRIGVCYRVRIDKWWKNWEEEDGRILHVYLVEVRKVGDGDLRKVWAVSSRLCFPLLYSPWEAPVWASAYNYFTKGKSHAPTKPAQINAIIAYCAFIVIVTAHRNYYVKVSQSSHVP